MLVTFSSPGWRSPTTIWRGHVFTIPRKSPGELPGRQHCLELGVASKIFCNCSAKPSSKSRSASSKTSTLNGRWKPLTCLGGEFFQRNKYYTPKNYHVPSSNHWFSGDMSVFRGVGNQSCKIVFFVWGLGSFELGCFFLLQVLRINQLTSNFSWQPLGKTLPKVKLLLGPTFKISRSTQRSKGNKANLRCAKYKSWDCSMKLTKTGW